LLVEIDEVRGQQVGREVLLTPILEEEGGEYDIPRYMTYQVSYLIFILYYSSDIYIFILAVYYLIPRDFFLHGPRTPLFYGILILLYS
jgi:hypothetical protein